MQASHAQTGVGNLSDSNYRGGRGLDPEVIAEITHRYGFDKPIHERYFKMLWDYIRFDFGDSLFRSASVLSLLKSDCQFLSPLDYGVHSSSTWFRFHWVSAKPYTMAAVLMSGVAHLLLSAMPFHFLIRHFIDCILRRWQLLRPLSTAWAGFGKL